MGSIAVPSSNAGVYTFAFSRPSALVKEMTLFMLIERVGAAELKNMNDALKKVEKVAEQVNLLQNLLIRSTH
jgi:hypothetical protein